MCPVRKEAFVIKSLCSSNVCRAFLSFFCSCISRAADARVCLPSPLLDSTKSVLSVFTVFSVSSVYVSHDLLSLRSRSSIFTFFQHTWNSSTTQMYSTSRHTLYTVQWNCAQVNAIYRQQSSRTVS